MSRTRYAALFSVISTIYGSGNGSTTFNLPNMRSRFPIGADSTYSLASTGGSTQENLTNINQIPLHNHGINDPGHSHGVSDPGHNHSSNAIGGQGNLGLCIANGANTATETDSSGGELNVWTTPFALSINNQTTGLTVNSQTTGITTQNNGASPTSPFDILNPYLALNYIIKF